MNATPAICPLCGELVVALVLNEEVNLLPDHPDSAWPKTICLASWRAVRWRVVPHTR